MLIILKTGAIKAIIPLELSTGTCSELLRLKKYGSKFVWRRFLARGVIIKMGGEQMGQLRIWGVVSLKLCLNFY